LDKFARDYKKKSLDSEIRYMSETIFDIMTRIFIEKDPLLTRQARLPLYYLLTREAKKQNQLRNVNRDSIRNFFKKIQKNKELAKTSDKLTNLKLSRFDDLSKQGTNDAGNLKARFHIMSSFFHIDSSRIDKLD